MERVTVLYLWYAKTRRQRRHPWVHQRQNHFGEYHHLLLEQCLVDGRFQRYFCLSRTQFEDLLSHVGRISPRDTIQMLDPRCRNLPICLRKSCGRRQRSVPSMRHQIRGASAACGFNSTWSESRCFIYGTPKHAASVDILGSPETEPLWRVPPLTPGAVSVDGRFQRYFCLSRTQFEDLLSHVGTNQPSGHIYRCWIPLQNTCPSVFGE
ncbi:hypothetical protein CRENBAI_016521 [Crenichthys baileyi]|uniref:Uncharacterized protein n=1 Tax=Crenichthys baileyi TaxID=28760 RepID=A0AAV9S783_9TELE